MPVAKELNRRFAGKQVPFTLKMAYTGCPIGCGEPMVSDIGVMKFKDHYNFIYWRKKKRQRCRGWCSSIREPGTGRNIRFGS